MAISVTNSAPMLAMCCSVSDDSSW